MSPLLMRKQSISNLKPMLEVQCTSSIMSTTKVSLLTRSRIRLPQRLSVSTRTASGLACRLSSSALSKRRCLGKTTFNSASRFFSAGRVASMFEMILSFVRLAASKSEENTWVHGSNIDAPIALLAFDFIAVTPFARFAVAKISLMRVDFPYPEGPSMRTIRRVCPSKNVARAWRTTHNSASRPVTELASARSIAVMHRKLLSSLNSSKRNIIVVVGEEVLPPVVGRSLRNLRHSARPTCCGRYVASGARWSKGDAKSSCSICSSIIVETLILSFTLI